MSSWWLPQMSLWMHICSCCPRSFVRSIRLSHNHTWYFKRFGRTLKMITGYDIESLKSGTENLFNLRCLSFFFRWGCRNPQVWSTELLWRCPVTVSSPLFPDFHEVFFMLNSFCWFAKYGGWTGQDISRHYVLCFLHWWVRLSIVFEEYVTQSRYPCKSIRTLYRSKRDSELHHVAMPGLRVCWTQ